jgi:type IV secretion system protein VirD4
MKRKVISGLIVLVLLFVATWALVAAIKLLMTGAKFTKDVFLTTLVEQDVLTLSTMLAVGAGVGILIWLKPGMSSSVVANNKDLENSRFMTDRDIRKAKSLKRVRYSRLHKVKGGIPLAVTKNKVVVADNGQTLVTGATGSGKTVGALGPTVQAMANYEVKPSLIITDPKGDLYLNHSQHLKNNGYNIQQIDLTDGIFNSARWNPFENIYNNIQRINELKADGIENAEEIVKLRTDVYQEMQDLIHSLFTLSHHRKEDDLWNSGARDLILAVAYAFIEDVEDEIMEKEQFNLFNLINIIVNNTGNECAGLKQYFSNRSVVSKAVAASKQVLDTSKETMSSYLTTVHNYLKDYNEVGITTLTSSSDMDFSKFDEEPSALFIRISPARPTRNKIAVALIEAAYKQLMAKAENNLKLGKTKKSTLLRDVHFILEEFGNLPRLSKIAQIVTLGREYKIWFYGVIQDYQQLNNLYGNDATIIKNNCIIKIFIGSTDKATIEEVSTLCGKKKTAISGYSENHKDEMSSSVSVKETPIIYPSELERLNSKGNYGNAVILYNGHYPLRTKFTPTFMGKKLYTLGGVESEGSNKELLNEADIMYTATFREGMMRTEEKLAMPTAQIKQEVQKKQSKTEATKSDILATLKPYLSVDVYASLLSSTDIVAALDRVAAKTKNNITLMYIDDVLKILREDENLCEQINSSNR